MFTTKVLVREKKEIGEKRQDIIPQGFWCVNHTSSQGTRIITGDNYSSRHQDSFWREIQWAILMKVWRWVVNDVAFTFLLELPESGRIITMMWNRSWGVGAFKDIARGICCLKMQSIWQDWQDLFTIRAVKRGDSPYTAEMAREVAIWSR